MMTDIITRYKEMVMDNDSIRTNLTEKRETPVTIIRELMVNPKNIEEKTIVFSKTTKKNSNSNYYYH